MPLPEKVYTNKAIVALRDECGWSINAIAKAFEEKDKRNIARKYEKYSKKYKRSEEESNNENK